MLSVLLSELVKCQLSKKNQGIRENFGVNNIFVNPNLGIKQTFV